MLTRPTKIVRVSKLIALWGIWTYPKLEESFFFYFFLKNRTIYSSTCGLKGIEVANYFHSSQIHMNPKGPSLCKQTPNYT